MGAGDELRAAVGLTLLAAAAWTLPPLRTAVSPPRPAPPTAVYALASERRLLWSPSRHPTGFRAAEGHVLGPTGAPLRPVGGWTGLLLGNPLELNGASLADLGTLRGIGPKKAAAILAFREANGPFRDVGELARVPGIGPKSLEKLAPLLRVGSP